MKNKGLLRVTAFAISLIFTAETIAWSAPSLINPFPKKEYSAGDFFESIKIPESIATVESKFLSATPTALTPILYIQDAHAHPEAQRNIQLLLKSLADQKKIKAIGLEAAVGKVDASGFYFFPVPEANRAIYDDLAAQGELTGAELFALESKASDIPLVGVDDLTLYRQSYNAYQKVISLKKPARNILNSYAAELEKIAAKLPHDLGRILRTERSWDGGTDHLEYFHALRDLALKHLGVDFSDARAQFEWPNLTRLMIAEKIQSGLKPENLSKEILQLTDLIKEQSIEAGTKKFLIEGLQRMGDPQAGKEFREWLTINSKVPGVHTARVFMELLHVELRSTKIPLVNYPALLDWAGLRILQEELNASQLMKEAGLAQAQLEKKLAVTEKQKKAVELVKDFRTLEKMLSLTLTREDYDHFKKRRKMLTGTAVKSRFFAATKNNLPRIPQGLLRRSEIFYRLSEKRDRVLFENTLKLSKDSKSPDKAIVLIAGGFHTFGLKSLLEEEQIPYLTLTPHMSLAGDEQLYEQVMMGKHGAELKASLSASGLGAWLLLKPETNLPERLLARQYDVPVLSINRFAVPALRQKGWSEDKIKSAIRQALALSELRAKRSKSPLRFDGNLYVTEDKKSQGGHNLYRYALSGFLAVTAGLITYAYLIPQNKSWEASLTPVQDKTTSSPQEAPKSSAVNIFDERRIGISPVQGHLPVQIPVTIDEIDRIMKEAPSDSLSRSEARTEKPSGTENEILERLEEGRFERGAIPAGGVQSFWDRVINWLIPGYIDFDLNKVPADMLAEAAQAFLSQGAIDYRLLVIPGYYIGSIWVTPDFEIVPQKKARSEARGVVETAKEAGLTISEFELLLQAGQKRFQKLTAPELEATKKLLTAKNQMQDGKPTEDGRKTLQQVLIELTGKDDAALKQLAEIFKAQPAAEQLVDLLDEAPAVPGQLPPQVKNDKGEVIALILKDEPSAEFPGGRVIQYKLVKPHSVRDLVQTHGLLKSGLIIKSFAAQDGVKKGPTFITEIIQGLQIVTVILAPKSRSETRTNNEDIAPSDLRKKSILLKIVYSNEFIRLAAMATILTPITIVAAAELIILRVLFGIDTREKTFTNFLITMGLMFLAIPITASIVIAGVILKNKINQFFEKNPEKIETKFPFFDTQRPVPFGFLDPDFLNLEASAAKRRKRLERALKALRKKEGGKDEARSEARSNSVNSTTTSGEPRKVRSEARTHLTAEEQAVYDEAVKLIKHLYDAFYYLKDESLLNNPPLYIKALQNVSNQFKELLKKFESTPRLKRQAQIIGMVQSQVERAGSGLSSGLSDIEFIDRLQNFLEIYQLEGKMFDGSGLDDLRAEEKFKNSVSIVFDQIALDLKILTYAPFAVSDENFKNEKDLRIRKLNEQFTQIKGKANPYNVSETLEEFESLITQITEVKKWIVQESTRLYLHEHIDWLKAVFPPHIFENPARSEVRVKGGEVVAADKVDVAKLTLKGVHDLSKLEGKAKVDEIVRLNPRVMMVRSATKVKKELIDQLPNLKAIIRLGHGLDNVDRDYAKQKGIEVIGTKGSKKSVSAWALRAMAIAQQRTAQIPTPEKDEASEIFLPLSSFREASDKKLSKHAIEELARPAAATLLTPLNKRSIESLRGKTVGIIGAGDIGLEFAESAQSLGMRVLIYSPSLFYGGVEKREKMAEEGYQFAPIEEIEKTAHFTVLFTGLNPSTKGLINAASAERMIQNPNFIGLINPDRLELVTDDAVQSLITNRKFYLVDEIPSSPYLQKFGIYTPHIGGSTKEAEAGVFENADKILTYLASSRSESRADRVEVKKGKAVNIDGESFSIYVHSISQDAISAEISTGSAVTSVLDHVKRDKIPVALNTEVAPGVRVEKISSESLTFSIIRSEAQQKIIGEPIIGKSAKSEARAAVPQDEPPITEAGYQAVAQTGSVRLMKIFVLRVMREMNLKLNLAFTDHMWGTADSALTGLAVQHTAFVPDVKDPVPGTGPKDLASLRADLIREKGTWIIEITGSPIGFDPQVAAQAEAFAQRADLESEQDYLSLAAFGDVTAMEIYTLRQLEEMGLQMNPAISSAKRLGGLHGFAPWFTAKVINQANPKLGEGAQTLIKMKSEILIAAANPKQWVAQRSEARSELTDGDKSLTLQTSEWMEIIIPFTEKYRSWIREWFWEWRTPREIAEIRRQIEDRIKNNSSYQPGTILMGDKTTLLSNLEDDGFLKTGVSLKRNRSYFSLFEPQKEISEPEFAVMAWAVQNAGYDFRIKLTDHPPVIGVYRDKKESVGVENYDAGPQELYTDREGKIEIRLQIIRRSEVRNSGRSIDSKSVFRVDAKSEARMDLNEAISEIVEWKKQNQTVVHKRHPENPFSTYFILAVKEIYEKHRLFELTPKERLKFVEEAFDQELFPRVHSALHSILKRIDFNPAVFVGNLNPAQYYRLGQILSDIEADLTFQENRLLRSALNRVFDFWDREKRILELTHLIGEMDIELSHPGHGDLPLISALQDMHGGSQRAASLVGFVMGLDESIYSKLEGYEEKDVVERLKLLLNQSGIDVDALPARFIGLNDKYDRGDDPIGVFELVKWLRDSRKAKPFQGNHDLWRTIAVLGIHHYFAQQGIDFESKDVKGDHIAHWAKEAFEHTGWGDIELDQINQRRFNKALAVINEILAYRQIELLEPIDLKSLRLNFEKELKEKKKHNAAVRASLQAGDGKYTDSDYLELPDIFTQTLGALRRLKETYNIRVRDINSENGFDIPIIDFPEVNLENFWKDQEIVDRALWELRNGRLFHIDILGSLHQHNIIPVNYEQGGFEVEYLGVKGIPALELLEEDLISFGENRTTLASDSQTFRSQMWAALGEGLTIINAWYSDINPVAKATAVRHFIDQGGLPTLGQGILGQNTQLYGEREANFLIFWGHNEAKKFKDNQVNLPYIYLYPEQGTGLVNIDYEMSRGYSDQGAIVTFFKRDREGKITGFRRWGYRPKSKVIEDLTFEDIDQLDGNQRAFLETLADGPKFISWYRKKALNQILSDAVRLHAEAVQKNRMEKAHYFAEIIKKTEQLVQQRSEIRSNTISQRLTIPKPTTLQTFLSGYVEVEGAGADALKIVSAEFQPEAGDKISFGPQDLDKKIPAGKGVLTVAYPKGVNAAVNPKKASVKATSTGSIPVQQATIPEKDKKEFYQLIRVQLVPQIDQAFQQHLHEATTILEKNSMANRRESQEVLKLLDGTYAGKLKFLAEHIKIAILLQPNSDFQLVFTPLADSLELAYQSIKVDVTAKQKLYSLMGQLVQGINPEQIKQLNDKDGFFPRLIELYEKAAPESARSEIRLNNLESEVTALSRNMAGVLFVTDSAARKIADSALINPKTLSDWNLLLFGENSVPVKLDQQIVSQLNQKAVSRELPRTVILVDSNEKNVFGEADLKAMELAEGSRVAVFESRKTSGKIWAGLSKLKFAVNISRQRLYFEGALPTAEELSKIISQTPGNIPLLVFPAMTPDAVLEQYQRVSSTQGFVVSLPKNNEARFAFSYLLGHSLPATLLKDVPSDDLLKVALRSDALSRAYVPVWAEGRFAKWAVERMRDRLFAQAA